MTSVGRSTKRRVSDISAPPSAGSDAVSSPAAGSRGAGVLRRSGRDPDEHDRHEHERQQSELVRPPMTTVPSDRFAIEPGSSASASGIMPAIIDAVVMTIGRKRTRAASSIAVTLSMPARTRLAGEIDQQNPVLAHQPDQHHDADDREQVQALMREREAPNAPIAATGIANMITSGAR